MYREIVFTLCTVLYMTLERMDRGKTHPSVQPYQKKKKERTHTYPSIEPYMQKSTQCIWRIRIQRIECPCKEQLKCFCSRHWLEALNLTAWPHWYCCNVWLVLWLMWMCKQSLRMSLSLHATLHSNWRLASTDCAMCSFYSVARQQMALLGQRQFDTKV